MNNDYRTSLKIDLGFELNTSRPITSYSNLVHHSKCESMHAHPRAQLLYTRTGVAQIEGLDIAWMTSSLQAIWIPPHVEHQVYCPEECLLYSLFFDPSIIPSSNANALDNFPQRITAFHISDLVKELIYKINSFYNPDQWSLPQKNILQVLMDELRQIQPSDHYLPLSMDSKIQSILNTIRADLSKKYTLEYFSAELGLSSRTLSRLFNQELGISYGEWCIRLKMLEGIKKINTGQSIKSIAYDLGYESISAFIYSFKKRYHCSPGQYLSNTTTNRTSL